MIFNETTVRPQFIFSTYQVEYRRGHYLLCFYHYSKRPKFAELKNVSCSKTVYHLKSLFSKFVIPNTFISGNGPQCSPKKYTNFPRSYGFVQKISSPHSEQSNREAERTIQTLKNLIKKTTNPYRALLAYRNTADKAEPLLRNDRMSQEIIMILKTRKWQQKINIDNHAMNKSFMVLKPNENALMRNKNNWSQATVHVED